MLKNSEITVDEEIDSYFFGETVKKDENNNCENDINSDINADINPDMNKNTDIIAGIDLGTTNSCIAIWRNQNLEIIPDEFGNRTIPSIVSFTNFTNYYGIEAKNQLHLNPENTFYEVKRLIGRKIDDPVVQTEIPLLSYKIINDDSNNIRLKANLSQRREIFSPEEISSFILIKLKTMAEAYLKSKIEKVVISVPAYFNDSQREATKDAATIAGLQCVRIINEPTASALAYGLEKISINRGKDINVMVYDLGGGTLDVSILNIADGMFQVLASTGNTHLGGADFDNRLVTFCINEFCKRNKLANIDTLNPISTQKLRKSCENAKKILSVTSQAIIAVKDFFDEKNLYVTITRNQFEEISQDLFILCLKPAEDALRSSELGKDDIDEIILVGGGTRMPLVRQNLSRFFPGKKINNTINPDEVVAAGAAIQGFILANGNDPFSENVVLLDIIPLSLGLETIGGIMDVIIPLNSVIPVKRKKKFSTDSDFVTSVKIKIFEGERKMTKDNIFIGEFELCGIESAPRGIPEIEICFSIDINGIISVTAEDLKNNNNKNCITITGNKSRLKPEEIKKLIEEAKEMESKDKLEREKKQLYYEIDDLCSNILININNEEFKLKETDKDIIRKDVEKIMAFLKEKDYLERTTQDYNDILLKIKKKYGTLILKNTNELENVKPINKNQEGTTIYSNDDEEINQEIFFIDNEIKGVEDEELKKELKELRENLIHTCYSIFDILTSKSLMISKQDNSFLKDFIDDILLWVHVKEKIDKEEYIQKIVEVNNLCNEVVSKYPDNNLFENKEAITRNELEQLCYTIMSSILSNMFSAGEAEINLLKNRVNETLEWLLELDVKKRKAELENQTFEISNTIFEEKLSDINNLCNDIFQKMLSE